MKLRHQLVIIGLLLPALPMTSLLLFRTMEQNWRLAAEQQLLELTRQTARSVAPVIAPLNLSATIALPYLEQPVLLDGYDSEWQEVPALPNVDASSGLRWVRAGTRDDDLLLFLRFTSAPDTDGRGRDPARIGALALSVSPETPPLLLPVQSPGLQQWALPGNPGSLRGYWNETAEGDPVLELRLPLALVQPHGLSLCWRPADPAVALATPCLFGTPNRPLPLTLIDHRTVDTLTGLIPSRSRLALLATDGRTLLALDNDPTRESDMAWSATELLLGRLATLLSPTTDTETIRWQMREDPRLTSLQISLPLPSVEAGGEAVQRSIGEIVLERRLSDLTSLANAGLGDALLRNAALTLVLFLVLLGYAAWLSRRIRRLHDDVRRSLDAETRYQVPFTASTLKDELGDLSRTFGHLLEELRAYADYRESFAAKLTHECRTPVSIIASSLQLAQDTPEPREQAALLQRAQAGCQRLQQLIQAMGASARLERLLGQFEPHPLALDEWLTAIGAHYCGLAAPHKLICAPPPGPAMIHGHEDLLAQALDKLMENARDFTPPGGSIQLGLELHGDSVDLVVDNDGPALPDTPSGRLFEPYQSHRHTMTRSPSSGPEADLHLGLGLTLVRLIAEWHGGSAALENRVGGVRARLRLPLTT